MVIHSPTIPRECLLYISSVFTVEQVWRPLCSATVIVVTMAKLSSELCYAMQINPIRTGLLSAILLSTCGYAVAASDHPIDLACDSAARSIVQELNKDGLLPMAEDARARAEAVIRARCAQQELAARAQHQADRQLALDNWFFEHRADKPGNRRLTRKR